MAGYVDLFVLAVPKKNLLAYAKSSRVMGKVMKENGALEYREFLGEDLKVPSMNSFISIIKPKSGETIVSAVIGFKSRAHRDQVNKRSMADPRVKKLMEQMTKSPPMDMKHTYYGGFETFVTP